MPANGKPPAAARLTSRLAVRIVDQRNQSTVVRWFFHSPVTVGRQDWSSLCLDARGVADDQGAFVFGPGYLRFIDLQPAGGTLVDGVPVRPDCTIELGETSTLLIGPFRVSVRLEPIPGSAEDPAEPVWAAAATADTATRQVAGGAVGTVGAVAAGTATGGLLDDPSEVEILARALQVIEAIAAFIVGYRDEGAPAAAPPSPLTRSTDIFEVMAYLLDPDTDGTRLAELLALLRQVLSRPPRM